MKTAVVGLGNMGRHHVRHLKQLSDLVAVCDRTMDHAEGFASNYRCKAYDSLEVMLDSEELDAISLTAPTSLHYELAKTILSRGVSVLIEKPIAETTQQAEELIQLAKDNNAILMVGHIERFNPAIIALKKFIDDGELGTITSMISRRVNVFPKQIKDANVAIDLGVHDIDLVTYLVGEEPLNLTSHFGSALIEDRADHLEIFLEFSSASALVQVNWITPIPIRKLTLTGTKAYVELDYMAKTVTVYPSSYEKTDESVAFAPSEPYDLEVVEADALASELTHFLDCVKTGAAPITTGDMGKTALSLALDSLK